MIHIDWLSIYQDFDVSLPQLVGEIRTAICGTTGELLQERTTGYIHEGSFDTSMLIKFDGRRLFVSGNPSAWCRRDNLFGCPSVDAAVAIINKVVTGLGYPAFFDLPERAEKPTNVLKKIVYGSVKDKFYSPSATLTRLDLTKNFASDTKPLDMLRYLSSFSFRGQHGYLYPNGRTVEWMGKHGDTGKGSKRIYFKYYDKSFDLEGKFKKLKLKRSAFTIKCAEDFVKQKFLEDQLDYIKKLLEYTIENNVVRFEVELKAKTLQEHGLHRLTKWSAHEMIIQLDKYLPHIKQVVQFNNKIDLYGQLLSVDVPTTKARNASIIGQLWLDGHDVHYSRNNAIKKDAYYRARQLLLLIGFDIAAPMNVMHFPKVTNTLTLRSLPVPEWYEVA